MDKKKATNIRVELETKARLDKCVILKTDTYDTIIRRILSEERYLPALERAWKRAYEADEAYKKCPATPIDVRNNTQQKAKSAREYLFTVVKNFIEDVHRRSE